MKTARRRKRFPVASLLRSLALAAAVCAALAAGWYGWRQRQRSQMLQKHSTVSTQILQVAELTALKYTYNDVVAVRKTAVAGMSRAYSIVKYTGSIRIGIPDVRDMDIGLGADGTSVTVVVPRAQVLENALLRQEVFDEKDGIFTAIATQDVMDEIARAMDEHQAEVQAGTLLAEADSRVCSLIAAMLRGAGFESVTVRQKG